MSRLLVGVAAYGCQDRLSDCLNALQRCREYIEFDTLVINNGSPPDDRRQVSDVATRSGARLIENDLNKGCAGAWNQILSAAFSEDNYDYVLLAGVDTIPHERAVANLVARYERGGVDMVSGAATENDPVPEPRDSEDVGPDFSFLLLPRRVVERVGKFDERFWPAYFEDDDYHRRAIQLGVGLGIRTCLAPFRHYRSTTINRYPDLRQHFDRNRLYFIAKHGGTPDELRLPKPPIPAK